MREEGIWEFHRWVENTQLEKLLDKKGIVLFKENNMSFEDLKLFGVTEKADLLFYDYLEGVMDIEDWKCDKFGQPLN